MSIDGIHFLEDGTAEAYYFDGGLFAGHLMVIPINEDGSLDEAVRTACSVRRCDG